MLAIDTSAVCASACVFDGEKVVGEFLTNTGLTHSQTLMPMIDSLLKCVSIDISEIDAFALNKGPGSFTGLRIGIACIKGLAQIDNKPCIGVSSLESIAYNGIMLDGIICACMDARCSQVYNALFRAKDNKLIRLCEDRAITVLELEKELKSFIDNGESVFLAGDGAKVADSLLSEIKCTVLPENNLYQKASNTAKIAYNLLLDNKTDTPQGLMPVYLRLPQAERELRKKNATL